MQHSVKNIMSLFNTPIVNIPLTYLWGSQSTLNGISARKYKKRNAHKFLDDLLFLKSVFHGTCIIIRSWFEQLST